MKKKYIYISLLGLFLSFSMLGQEKQIERANKQYDQLSYIDARATYIKVVENGYESQDVFEKIADSYYFNADLANAAVWYEKLYSKYSSKMASEYLFRYSQSLKNVGKYDKSDEIMQAFDQATGQDEKRVELFKEESNYLDMIALQSGRFNIKNLRNINSVGSDFGPSFYKNEAVVFASSRRKAASKIIHEWNEESFLDLYSTNRINRESLSVEGTTKLNLKINTKFHESSTVFTKDGKTMYFTGNNYIKNQVKTNKEGTTLLKLFRAEKQESGKWSNVVELPFNNDNYSVAHPALSPDEKQLYFASDMEGTNGLSDLYVVAILGGNKYSKPINLGESINTEGRETFPFISESGDLFFASDGHIGLGGLDVFVAKCDKTKENGEFNKIYNVGAPVNTSDDDFSFIIDEKTKVGFFTSNRSSGMGNDDIYSFKETKDLITVCAQTLSGVVTDSETKELLPGTVVTLFDDKMEKLTSTTADEKAMYELPVECNNKYIIRAQKDTYEPSEVDLVTNNEYKFKHNQPIELSKGTEPLAVVSVNLGNDLAKILQLQPIYFDLDKSFIRPDAEIELQKVIAAMKQYPKLIIDVRSHTDSRQTNAYNASLSERRAKSTIKYMVQKGGINTSRLSGRGYGETELQNNCADGVKCSEEQHQLNRRSEFIIVKQ